MDNFEKALEQMPEKKKMYHVEKFLPPACPKCKARFQNETRYKEVVAEDGTVTAGEKEQGDYSLLLGDIVDGKKVIRETTGYNIIICAHCRNYTARIPLETYQLSSKEKAEQLVAEQGFQNLMEVWAFGNMQRDCHAIHNQSPGIKVRDAMKDYPDDDKG